MRSLLSSFIIILLFQQNVHAYPLRQDGTFSSNPLDVLTQFAETFTANYDFSSIVALSGCSASLVRFETSRETDPAMVLTNGHCIGNFINPGEHVAHQATRRSVTLLDREARGIGRVNAREILYATMTRTDMALYVLEKSFRDIANEFNTQPLTLASRRAGINDPIEVISGYWKRGFSCAIEAIVYSLKEGEWIAYDSIRYSRPGCNTFGGTSGSPVVLANSRTVVGVNNTGNESGGRCGQNNPCEIDQNGNVTFQKGFSYGQQISWIYACLDGNNQLDLNRQGCQLPH
jgi:V8-like Glu-specific endopeptidase